MTTNLAVEAHGLVRNYRRGSETICALKGVDLNIETGSFTGVMGRSGAGKTTLLNMIGLMDRPTGGTLLVMGHHATEPGAHLDAIRRHNVGFVFQEFYLIPTLSALENVMLPSLWGRSRERAGSLAGLRRTAREYARLLLERVGLSHRMTHRPTELSGGEMQRVAVARALFNAPRLLLADEPTGNLDTGTRDSILDLLQEFNRKEGLTVIVATHDLSLKPRFARLVELEEGNVCLPRPAGRD